MQNIKSLRPFAQCLSVCPKLLAQERSQHIRHPCWLGENIGERISFIFYCGKVVAEISVGLQPTPPYPTPPFARKRGWGQKCLPHPLPLDFRFKKIKVGGKTITAEYYSSLLEQLLEEIRQKRPQKLHHGVLFHQDNAPAHKAHATMATIDNCGFQIVQNPPYSPDLAPSDYFLFSNLKKISGGPRYANDDDVMDAIKHFWGSQDTTFFRWAMEQKVLDEFFWFFAWCHRLNYICFLQNFKFIC